MVRDPGSNAAFFVPVRLSFLSRSHQALCALLLGNKAGLEDFGLPCRVWALTSTLLQLPSYPRVLWWAPSLKMGTLGYYCSFTSLSYWVAFRWGQHSSWFKCKAIHKCKPLLSVVLQELFLTEMLTGQFFITRAIAFSGYEIQHFNKTHLLRLTSSFSHTGAKFAFSCFHRHANVKNYLGIISRFHWFTY